MVGDQQEQIDEMENHMEESTSHIVNTFPPGGTDESDREILDEPHKLNSYLLMQTWFEEGI